MFCVAQKQESHRRTVSDKVAEKTLSVWKDIPGYAYRYRISDYGEVQRYNERDGKWHALTQYKSGGKRNRKTRVAVKLTLHPSVHRHVFVVDLMADAFLGGRDAHQGMILAHSNGNCSDCSKNNLYWTTYHDLGKRYGGPNRRSVEKVDKDGNVVDLFRSTMECCEHEYISRKTLWRIITGKTKNPYLTTGYTYRYEDDSYEK